MHNIIKISKDEAVSSDFIGESHSCILDADSSLQLKPNFFKLVCWYENEYSYACRVLDSVFYSEKQTRLGTPSKLVNIKTKYIKQDMGQLSEVCRNEVLYSVSDDTGLKSKEQQARLLMLKKPISPHKSGTSQCLNSIKDTKKRNEILKTSNEKDVSQPVPRQNRSSFFHSCVAISPKNREEIECIKAHERLEMLKIEFSKMVNITESLLKKSCISNIHIQPQDKVVNKKEQSKSNNIFPDINIEEIKNSCKTFSETNNNVQKGNFLSDVGGDYRSNIGSRNVNILNKIKEHNLIEKTIPQFLETPPKNNLDKILMFEKALKDFSRSNNVARFTTPINTTTTCNQVLPEKNINNDDKGVNDKIPCISLQPIPQNFQVQYCILKKKAGDEHILNSNVKAEQESHEKRSSKWKRRIRPTDNGFFSLFKKNDATELSLNTHVGTSSSDYVLNNDSNNNESNLSECVHVENIVNESQRVINDILNETQNQIDSQPLGEEIVTFSDETKDEIRIPIDVKNDSVQDLNQKTSDDMRGLSSPERNITESDHTSKCGSPGDTINTFSNIEINKHRQDIYDKLDSASGTDSNNSFQINERKSQIINIADLTTSLEDLARLDKICKIIEISDELSNKLFSSLDNVDATDIRKKKWSFKDLCDKIKLDDFCDKVFGSSSG